jgi:cyclomaltodextrinase / maltogenic alpha-amylase / neopullulanase
LPGVPLIYNGDEAGASFEPYDEGPPIEWNDGGELAMHYRELAAMRRQNATLRTNELQLLRTDRDEALLAYVRPADSGSADVLVVLNFSARPLIVRGADAAAQKTLDRFGRGRIRLAPHAALIVNANDTR